MNRKLWILLLTVALSALAAAQADQPTFKSKAQLVLVPTVVTKDGKPVSGLTKEDFTLLHDGIAEQIASFEEVDAIPASIEPVHLPPHTVQNFTKADDHQDVVILVLDFLNGSFSSAARMRSYLRDMTRQFTDSRIPVTVLLLTDKGLIQVHSFSSAPENLTKAVEQWTSKTPVINDETSRVSWASPTSLTDISTSTIVLNNYAKRPGYSLRYIDIVAMTVHAVQDIAEAFRGVPGRKKMIWMSIRFPGALMAGQNMMGQPEPSDALMEMRAGDLGRRAWASLSDANIAVYPVDSNGVVNPTWEEHFSAQHGGERLTALFANSAPTVSLEVRSDTLSMLQVAQKTGGVACSDLPTNCVKMIQADANHYYVLGFYLHGVNKPGLHRLKVKVNQSDSSTRTRESFNVNSSQNARDSKVAAQQDPREVAAQKEFINTVLASPLDYTSLPLRLSWSELPPEGKDRRIELLLTAPPSGIPLDASLNMNLDYLAFIRPVGKTEGQTYPETLARKITPEQQQDLETNGFSYRHKVSLAPGRYEVRILLRDNLSQKIGTVSTLIDLTSTSAAKQ